MIRKVRELIRKHAEKPVRELDPRTQKIVDFCNKYALILQFIACFLLYFVICFELHLFLALFFV